MDDRKKTKMYSIIMLIIGGIGLVCTAIFMLSRYRMAQSVSETTKIMIYSFVPFIISFVMIKFGIQGLANKNTKK